MVWMKGGSGNATSRKGLNFIVTGLVVTVVSVAFREELYRVFPIVSPEVLALLIFFAGSTLSGFGTILTVAGFVRKTECGGARNIISQVIIIILLIIVLLTFVIFKRDQTLPRSVPSGPVSI